MSQPRAALSTSSPSLVVFSSPRPAFEDKQIRQLLGHDGASETV